MSKLNNILNEVLKAKNRTARKADKVFDFLQKDISEVFDFTSFYVWVKKFNKRIKKIEMGRLFFAATIILVFLAGFLLGGLKGNDVYLSLKGVAEKTGESIPFLKSLSSFFEKQNPRLSEPQVSQLEQSRPSPYASQISYEQAIITAVKKVSPAVVSIVISKQVPVYEKYYESPFPDLPDFFDFPDIKIPQYRQKGTKKQNIGGGTGFIVSSDGLVITNKHVVIDKDAEYTVITNDGKQYKAKVLARDPLQDLAFLKIQKKSSINSEGGISEREFPTVKLGDSDTLQIGQTVIAIGNALGEFRNTVSVGVISGLGRTITASGAGIVETLEDIIQTDAAINKGNSGGPLLNLKGEVIGVNVAMAEGAQSIGFAIPINQAKRNIKQIKTLGKIVYPFLGVRYVLINSEIKEEKDLSVDNGALIVGGSNGEPGVVPGSAADKAGLKEGDIILEFNGEKITPQNSLSKLVKKYQPGDKVTLRILRGKKEMTLEVVLGKKTSGEEE